MSEIINNGHERREQLKAIIKKLHQGVPLEEAKREFQEKFQNVSSVEIAHMEQELIAEGMPVDEIRRLCDVHTEVFKDNIEEKPVKSWDDTVGHPIHTFKAENRAIEQVLEKLKTYTESGITQDQVFDVLAELNSLSDIDKHYSRKENLLFPYLERYGVTGPAKVMWGTDDEIRSMIKTVIQMLKQGEWNCSEIGASIDQIIEQVNSMIYKEENILFPTSTRFLTDEEWYKIAEESDEIGYCLIFPEKKWRPKGASAELDTAGESTSKGYIKFETGILTVKEISAIFNHLPIDITYVDKNDLVKYFSHGKERIFTRTKAIIGRNVSNCHPPQSVHVVETLVEEFKAGKKDSEDFWIPLGDMYVLIRYFAVRDEQGEYMGVVEVTQNIKPIQAITGQKRLLSE